MLDFFDENASARGFIFSAGTFWPFFGEKVLAGGFLFSAGLGFFLFSAGTFMAILEENVMAGGFLFSAGIFWPFWAKVYQLGVFYPQPVHYGHFWRKCTGSGFFILSWSILAILEENSSAGGHFILSLYILAIFSKNIPTGGFYSLLVHFSLLWRKCTGWGFMFSAGTFWPFSAKMYRLRVFYSQAVHFGHPRRKRIR